MDINAKHRKLRIALVILCQLFFLLIPFTDGFSWDGIVIDKKTGAPIAGASIVRTWRRSYATPGGWVSSLLGAKEGVTDSNGKFSVPRLFYLPGIPVVTKSEEDPSVIYKPGYKFLTLKDRSGRIELERVQTLKAARMREWKEAGDNFDVGRTREARGTKDFPVRYWDVWERENEFLQPKHTITVSRPEVPPTETKTYVSGSDPSRLFPTQSTTYKPSNPGNRQTGKVWCDNNNWVTSECSVESLCAILVDRNEQSSRRSMAAYFLDRARDPKAISPLLKALQQDEDSNVRASAAFALGNFGDPQIIESLIIALGDRDKRVQQDAGAALGKIGEPAVTPLIHALKDPVRAEQAATVLGRNRDPRAVEPLIALFNLNAGRASLLAGYALINYKDPRAAREFVKTLEDEKHFFNKEAIRALVLTGHSSTDAVIPLLKHTNAKVRLDAATILGGIKDPKGTLPLVSSLKDFHVEVRKEAARSLGHIKDARAVSHLIIAWNDSESEVRSMVSEALINIGSGSVEFLIPTLRHKNSYFRWRAAWCLGWIGDISAVDPLANALDDRVPEVKWTVIEAIGRLGDNRSASALAKWCADEDEGIREITHITFQKIAGGSGCQ